MSEAHRGPEHHRYTIENPAHTEAPAPAPERHSAAEKAPGHEDAEHHKRHIESLKSTVEQTAASAKEHKLPSAEQESGAYEPSGLFVNKELRRMALDRTMVRVRKQLNPADRLLSRAIHAPVIDKISEAGARTVARPSGILGGGFAAAIGTSLYYWVSRHYGYEYNFSIFLILTGAGFAVGLISEVIYKMLASKKSG